MPSSSQQRSTTAREEWLERNTFYCPTYGARFNISACAANRRRPLLTDGAGGGATETQYRHPKCGETCPTLLAQTNKHNGPMPQHESEGSAWDLVSKATGCTSHTILAKKIGKHQGQVSRVFRELAEGKEPKGVTWEAILRISGLVPAQLLEAKPGSTHGKPGRQPAQQPAEQSTGQQLAAPTMMGTYPEDALCTAEQLNELAAAAGLFAPAAPPAEAAAPQPEASVDQATDDFELYLGVRYTQLPTPSCTVNKALDLVINSAAVRAFGLLDVTHVHLLYSRSTGRVALAPVTDGTNRHAFKLSVPSKSRDMRVVAFKGFMQRFVLHVPVGTHMDITKAKDGKIIVALQHAPTQGEEA